MGDGLKRVAKLCGGLIATDGRITVHYDAGGNPVTPVDPAELDRLRAALARSMKAEFIEEWLSTPKDALGGSTPLEAMESGDAAKVWRMAFLLGSGLPM